MWKKVCLLALAGSFMSGCMPFKKRTSYMDAYDSVQVDQMVANQIGGRVLQRTVVCLNARRESRPASPTTNQMVTWVTNMVVTYVTNQTVTTSTNQSRSLVTNQVPQLLAVSATTAPAGEASGLETNQTVMNFVSPPPTTNHSVTTGINLTLSKANNQTVTAANAQTLMSRQITYNTNQLSITATENQAITSETNLVITAVTNPVITGLTNVVVTHTNNWMRDYYLFTEITPSPEFSLASGESLVLLVDGVRHGFSPAASQTAFVSRKGFSSTLYKVPPQVLVDIANARKVKVRLKGVNSVIERQLGRGSRAQFKKFLLKYFVPEPASTSGALALTVTSATTSSHEN